MSNSKIIKFATSDLKGLTKARLGQTRQSDQTLVVRYTESALKVAKKIDQKNSKFVLVLDTNDEVCAFVNPDATRALLRNKMGIKSPTFEGAISELFQKENDSIEGFQSDLIFERPEPQWCERGHHYTSALPCWQHWPIK